MQTNADVLGNDDRNAAGFPIGNGWDPGGQADN